MTANVYGIVSLAFLLTAVFALNLQNNIEFSIPQANRLWGEKDILGNSTNFLYPVDVGPVTQCDKLKISRVLHENSNLTFAYSEWGENWGFSPSFIKTRRYLRGFAYRSGVTQIRRIEKGVFSNVSCVYACISEKDFLCRTAIYFHGDGGVCALYDVPANTTAGSDYYISSHDTADTWRIYLANETAECVEPDADGLAHPHFALGWRAMEAGWFELAHQQLDEAIKLDGDYIMAHVGKVLSNPQMGYGYLDSNGSSYIEILEDLNTLPGVDVTLSYQSRLVFDAVRSLLKEATYEEGLENMKNLFKDDETTLRDYIVDAIESNSLLLRTGSHQRLANQAGEGKVFALRFLTMNLNPYKAGRGRITAETRQAAVTAVFTYKQQDINGAAHIAAECIDIAEYYAEYALAFNLIEGIKDFLYRNTEDETGDGNLFLFRQDRQRGFLVANGVNVDFMSLALQQVQEFERFHFYQLQVLKLVAAQQLWDSELSKTEHQYLALRAAANGYFSLYGDVLKQNERALHYVENYESLAPIVVPADNESPYQKISKAYYWTAVAVSQLYNGEEATSDIILSILDSMSGDLPDNYKTLLSLYSAIITAVKAYVNGDLTTAYDRSVEAGERQILLKDADFTVGDDEYSQYMRNLIPLGLQFKAEMFGAILKNKMNTINEGTLNMDTVVAAYREAVATPPLNTSRSLYGLALALREKRGNLIKEYNEPNPEYIGVMEELGKQWILSDLPDDDESSNPAKAAESILNEYYEAEPTGCRANNFDFQSGGKICWGGWIIIGVCVALVIIIATIVAVICLRRKYKAPARDKEKAAGFVFSGPNLTTDDSNTLQHGYSMNSLSRQSHTSEVSPYMSQTLEMRRGDYDYTQRSGTLGSAVGAEKLYLNAYGDTN